MDFKVLFVILLAVSMAMINTSFYEKSQSGKGDYDNYYKFSKGKETYSAPFFGKMLFPFGLLNFNDFRFATVLFFYLIFPCFFYVFLNRLDIATIFIFLPFLWALNGALAQITSLFFFMLAFHFFRENKPISICFMILTTISHAWGFLWILLLFLMLSTQKIMNGHGLLVKSMAISLFGYAPNNIAPINMITDEYYSGALHFLLTLPLLIAFFLNNKIVMFNIMFFLLIIASYVFPQYYANGNGAYFVWRIYAMFDVLILFAIAETKRLEQ